MAGTARAMDIESNPSLQGGLTRPTRGGWKALGLYAAVLACVAVVAFYSGRLGPSQVACFTGGVPNGEFVAQEMAAGELVAKEVAAAMADPDVKVRLERIAEDMAADPDFKKHMEQTVAHMQAQMLDVDFQERVNGLASRISSSLYRAGFDELQGSSGVASYGKRFATVPGVLPTHSRSKAAAAAGPRMQGGAEDMSGVTGPLGFWDPIGYSSAASEGRLRFLREAELKNGRVAMLAALGFIVAEQYPVFFHGDFNGPAIKTWTEIGTQGYFWPGVLFCIAIPEVFSVFNHNSPFEYGEWRTHRTDTEPGNYLDFDPLGLKPTDPDEFIDKQNKELNNGRLAMIGISGMIAQELVNGQKIVETLQQKAR